MALTEQRLGKILGVGSGTGSRPAAGQNGARWVDTTGPTEYYDDGSNWHQLITGAAASVVRLAETIQGGATATFDFASISSSYRNLKLVLSGRGDTAAASVVAALHVNGDTANNYEWAQIQEIGTGINNNENNADSSFHIGYLPAASSTANFWGSIEIVVFDYARTVSYKSLQARCSGNLSSGSTNVQVFLTGGVWKNTAAINELTLFLAAGNFITNSVATLWGEV